MGKREQELGKFVAEQVKEQINKAISKKSQEKGYTYTITTPTRGIWRDDNWDMWRNQYGHYNARCSFTTTDNKKNTDKEVEKMGLKIKKIDEMTIDEFKENEKAYDKIILNIDKDKFIEYEIGYGVEPFVVNIDYKVELSNKTIEFKEKGLVIIEQYCNLQSIPYEFIDKVMGVYYLTNGDD